MQIKVETRIKVETQVCLQTFDESDFEFEAGDEPGTSLYIGITRRLPNDKFPGFSSVEYYTNTDLYVIDLDSSLSLLENFYIIQSKLLAGRSDANQSRNSDKA
jgi:hypothetical protein